MRVWEYRIAIKKIKNSTRYQWSLPPFQHSDLTWNRGCARTLEATTSVGLARPTICFAVYRRAIKTNCITLCHRLLKNFRFFVWRIAQWIPKTTTVKHGRPVCPRMATAGKSTWRSATTTILRIGTHTYGSGTTVRVRRARPTRLEPGSCWYATFGSTRRRPSFR